MIGLYFRENNKFFDKVKPVVDQYGATYYYYPIAGNELPQNLEQVETLADQWLSYGCYCQIRSPAGLPGTGIFRKFASNYLHLKPACSTFFINSRNIKPAEEEHHWTKEMKHAKNGTDVDAALG